MIEGAVVVGKPHPLLMLEGGGGGVADCNAPDEDDPVDGR